MIKKIAIYDLDGTLIDSSHRFKIGDNGRIDLPHWRKNDIPVMIEKDSLLELANRAKSDISNREIYVIFATARACVEGDANYSYIAKHFGTPDKFVHRQGVDDNRGGAALKIQAIKPLLNLKQFKNSVVHVYEDNVDYLKDMCYAFRSTHKTVGHFNPSYQGV